MNKIKTILKKILRIISPLYRKTDDLMSDAYDIRDEIRFFARQQQQLISTSLEKIEIYHEMPYVLKLLENIQPEQNIDTNKLPFLLFNYAYNFQESTTNIGDNIQTLAVANALQQTFGKNIVDNVRYTDRDELSRYNAETVLCIMQGWFASSNFFWPSSRIIPVFIATHFTTHAQNFLKRLFVVRPELRTRYEVGCRDLATLKFCRSAGIKSYFSRCLTLTLPKRQKQPEQKKVFLVDIPDSFLPYIPDDIKENAVRVWQRTYPFDTTLHQKDAIIYQKIAKKLYECYEQEATLIITTAIHSAMPATAMGIPTVFIVPHEESALRSSALINILPRYSLNDLKNGKINFYPTAPDIEPLKDLLFENLKLSVAKTLGENIDQSKLDCIRQQIGEYNCITNPEKIEFAEKEPDIETMFQDVYLSPYKKQ